jgi:release factor glutamine methyltransferase
VDASSDAVSLAEINRTALGFNQVNLLQSDWFTQIEAQLFDIIVSNPPYIDPQDPHLTQGDVCFEPRSALVAEKAGLADIEHIVQQSWDYLKPQAWLLIEHGYDQAAIVRELFAARGFLQVATRTDYGGNERVTLGQKP